MTEFKTDPRIVLDLARERLRYQLSFYDAIDSKVATLFAAASGILALLFAVLAIREDQVDRGIALMLIFAGICYLAVFAAAALTHWPTNWKIGPELSALYQEIQERDEPDVVRALIAAFAACIQQNDQAWRGRLKPWALYFAAVALTGETVVLAVGLAMLTA